jgi:hypothetical protein
MLALLILPVVGLSACGRDRRPATPPAESRAPAPAIDSASHRDTSTVDTIMPRDTIRLP